MPGREDLHPGTLGLPLAYEFGAVRADVPGDKLPAVFAEDLGVNPLTLPTGSGEIRYADPPPLLTIRDG